MSDHIVRSFDDDLREITGNVAEMGGLAEALLGDAVAALIRMDTAKARSIIPNDKRIDVMQWEIEDKAILTIAKRQPMASDLREIVAALRICNDLERIGDLAKNIAKRVIAIDSDFHSKRLATGVEHIAELAMNQIKLVLNAYADRNLEAAAEVRERDEEIDAMYTSLFRELLTYMMEDPRNITFCTHLLFCAKNIERIGDHATNVAETVHYLVTGEQLEDDRPKVESTSIEPIDIASE